MSMQRFFKSYESARAKYSVGADTSSPWSPPLPPPPPPPLKPGGGITLTLGAFPIGYLDCGIQD